MCYLGKVESSWEIQRSLLLNSPGQGSHIAWYTILILLEGQCRNHRHRSSRHTFHSLTKAQMIVMLGTFEAYLPLHCVVDEVSVPQSVPLFKGDGLVHDLVQE